MALLLLTVIAASARLGFSSLTLLYVVLIVFSEFLKRAVFIFEGQQPQSQYIVLAVPSVLLLYLLVRTFLENAQEKPDAVSKVFLLFMAVLLANTWLMASRGIMESTLATGHSIFPLMAFFVFRKAARDSRFVDKFCLTIVVVGAIMAPYGVLQFFLGPGPIETAWAEASYGFSIQARRVHHLLTGEFGRPYMRAFSIFTDNFSFGFFEAAALIALIIYKIRNSLSMGKTLLLGVFVVSGLVSCFARSPWFAVLVCFTFLFCIPAVRRLPTIVTFVILLVLFFAVSYLAGFAHQRLFRGQRFNSPYTKGAFSVGSLEARTRSLPAFMRIVKQYPITGRGVGGSYGVSAKLTGSLSHTSNPVDDRHNFFGNLVWKGGLPALLLFLAFVYLVMAKARQHLLYGNRIHRKTVSLMLGFIIGLFLVGAFGQSSLWQGFFLAWCAFICSNGRRSGFSQSLGKESCGV
jgi:hypothetical protein